jgi:ubiquinone/menaquinone biosynthesis C-methylase UbiE
VQADVTRLPFRDGCFDRALSSQVIHHLPDPPARRAVIAEAARVLRKEGELVITAYNDAAVRRPFLAKEGRHPGGIYYRRFKEAEFRRLLEEAFDVLEIAGIRHLPARSVGERLMKRRLFRWLPALDRRMEGRFLSRNLAHLWLARGRKRTPGDGNGDEEESA